MAHCDSQSTTFGELVFIKTVDLIKAQNTLHAAQNNLQRLALTPKTIDGRKSIGFLIVCDVGAKHKSCVAPVRHAGAVYRKHYNAQLLTLDKQPPG